MSGRKSKTLESNGVVDGVLDRLLDTCEDDCDDSLLFLKGKAGDDKGESVEVWICWCELCGGFPGESNGV